jgi:hypothetical protein
MDIELIILVVGALAVVIALYAIREDKQDKEIKRLIDRAIDGDGDGWILDGTYLERKAPKKKAVVKKKTVKKAVAKKKATPAKKSVKKKAVAKKKSR